MRWNPGALKYFSFWLWVTFVRASNCAYLGNSSNNCHQIYSWKGKLAQIFLVDFSLVIVEPSKLIPGKILQRIMKTNCKIVKNYFLRKLGIFYTKALFIFIENTISLRKYFTKYLKYTEFFTGEDVTKIHLDYFWEMLLLLLENLKRPNHLKIWTKAFYSELFKLSSFY